MDISHNDEVVELQRDIFSALLLLAAGGWLVMLEVGLFVADANRSPWQPAPLLISLVLLLAADLVRRRRGALGAWLFVAALISGPGLALWSGSAFAPTVFILVLPVLVAGLLLPGAATLGVAGLAVLVTVGAAALHSPPVSLRNLLLLAGDAWLPALIDILAAGMMAFSAHNIATIIAWALDSQRKDARRAQLFFDRTEQLEQALLQLEHANGQLRLLNAELAEARRAADVANRLKTQFLANVSHELRTPLQIILGASAAARRLLPGDAPLPTAALAQLQQVDRSGEHLQRLINDLLDLSCAEVQALDVFPQTVDLRMCLVDVFESMRTRFASGDDVAWLLDLPPRLPLIQADMVRLRQMLFNLLSNAAKFTARGAITLGAEVVPPHVHLWVADTGSGVAREFQEQIFAPFVTGVAGDQPRGIGLGLSITRHLVALHHGKLTLDSQPGQGSTFHLYLPLPNVQGQPARLPVTAQPVLLALTRAKRAAAEVIAISQRGGVPIHMLRPGEPIADLLAKKQPVGLVWDLRHAQPEDWQVVEELRRHPQLCLLPLLLYHQDHAPLPDLSGGITSFLIKPLAEPALVQALQALQPAATDGSILVVDDDEQARAAYQRLLAHVFPQARVVASENGQRALEWLAANTPSLIVLDLMMPHVDGFTVLAWLRANPATRHTPVLVLSGRLLTLEDVQRLSLARVTLHSKGLLTAGELRTQLHTLVHTEPQLAPHTSAIVKQAIAYIHQHYTAPLSRQDLAAHVDVNERYLTEIFHRELQLSPWEYLNRFRILQAKLLLKTTDTSITLIAQQVGFEDPSYFGRVFRKETGLTPRMYRDALAGDELFATPTGALAEPELH